MRSKLAVAAKIIAAAVLLLAAAAAAAFFFAFSGTAPIVDGKELPGGGTIVKDGFVSAAVLPMMEDRKILLVDCGNDPKAGAIMAELKRRGLGPDDVREILLTHGHRDHVGGCAAFPRAQIFGMAAEEPLLEGREGSRAPIRFLMGKKDTGVRLGHPLTDGALFYLGGLKVEAYAVPGHTDGSAAYLINGVLYLGDSADSTKDGEVEGAKWLFSNDVNQDRASLKALAERLAPRQPEIKLLEFAHSAPLEGLAPLLDFARIAR